MATRLEIKKIRKIAQRIHLNTDGSYTTPTYNSFLKRSMEWPFVRAKATLVQKWSPLLEGIKSKHRVEAARVLQMEVNALKQLAGSRFDNRKYAIPAVIYHFSNK